MRLVVTGDRHWGRFSDEFNKTPEEIARVGRQRIAMWQALNEEHENNPITLLIEGEAPGADTWARYWAEEHGVPVAKFPAQWSKYGRAAGPVRNQQMIDEGSPDTAIAFHDDLENSKGTRDMVNRLHKQDIPVRIVRSIR